MIHHPTTSSIARPQTRPSVDTCLDAGRLDDQLAALEDLAVGADSPYATLRGLMHAELWQTSIALESTLRTALAGANTEITATTQEIVNTYLSVARRVTRLTARAMHDRQRSCFTTLGCHLRQTAPPPLGDKQPRSGAS